MGSRKLPVLLLTMALALLTGCGASGGGSGSQSSVQVSAAPPSLKINITSLQAGRLGTGYTQTLTATGGAAPYTWSISNGQLPNGLALSSSTGVISGTPGQSGQFSFTVTVVDSATTPLKATTNLSLTVTGVSSSPLTILTTTLPAAQAGVTYSAGLSATGGATPYTWGSGALPSGLTLDKNAGVVSGTATQTGQYQINFTVADASPVPQTASSNVALSVTSSAQLATTPPSINFSPVIVGNSANQQLTVTNTGSDALSVTGASTSGPGFSVSGLTTPLTLQANQSSSFNVVFTPVSAGPATGNLSLANTGATSPVNVPLAGSGTQAQAHSVDLAWTASATPTISGYNIFRSTVSGGPYSKLNSTAVTTTTYTDATVTSGTTYYYVATTVGVDGTESSPSNEAKAVIPVP